MNLSEPRMAHCSSLYNFTTRYIDIACGVLQPVRKLLHLMTNIMGLWRLIIRPRYLNHDISVCSCILIVDSSENQRVNLSNVMKQD